MQNPTPPQGIKILYICFEIVKVQIHGEILISHKSKGVHGLKWEEVPSEPQLIGN